MTDEQIFQQETDILLQFYYKQMMKNKLYFFKTNRLFSQQKNKKSQRSNHKFRKESSTSPQDFPRKPSNPEQNNLTNHSLMDLQYLDISQYMATQGGDQRSAIMRANENQSFLISSAWNSQQITHPKATLKIKNKQIFAKTKASYFIIEPNHQNKEQRVGREKDQHFLFTQMSKRKRPLKKFSTRQLSENNCSFPFKLYNDYIVQDKKLELEQLRHFKQQLNPQKRDKSPSFRNVNLNEQINNNKTPQFRGPYLKKRFEYDRKKSYYLTKSFQCSQELGTQIKTSNNQKHYSEKEIEKEDDKTLGIIDITLDLHNETKVKDKKIRQIMQILQKKRKANVPNKFKSRTEGSEGQMMKKLFNRKSNKKVQREVELFNMFSSNYEKLKKSRQYKHPYVKFNSMESNKKNIYLNNHQIQ